MLTVWQSSTLDAIRRYSARHATKLIRRATLIESELQTILNETGASGSTPTQTLSRVLQELRRAGYLVNIDRGVDLLLEEQIVAEDEDYTDAALDAALLHERLSIGDVPTSNVAILARRRRGQSRLRANTISNYGGRCGLCDVADESLLVTSHIVRWADDTSAQGRLSNVLCLCRMHDALWEAGYISLTDNYRVLSKPDRGSRIIAYLQSTADYLSEPLAHPPASEYLRRHRERAGLMTEPHSAA